MEIPANAIHPKTRKAWRNWLQTHHARDQGVWLIDYKKASGKQPLGYEIAVEEALCFGWVDSKPRKLDDARAMLWFAPRKPGTGWSAPNKRRVAKLISAGLMAPAGLSKVQAAKRDGSWNKLDAIEALEIPPDLDKALSAHRPAAANFAAFPRSVKRGILEWISTAKQPETRAKRIHETAVMAARNERANQWRKRAGETSVEPRLRRLPG